MARFQSDPSLLVRRVSKYRLGVGVDLVAVFRGGGLGGRLPRGRRASAAPAPLAAAGGGLWRPTWRFVFFPSSGQRQNRF